MTSIMNIKRCGGCRFGKVIPQDFSKRICHGAPPTAIEVPAPHGKQTFKMARPIVGVADEACALYQERPVMPLSMDIGETEIAETKQ